MTEPPHSAQFLTDARSAWWNADWLDLCARRLDLARVHSAVDVGAGRGHWTRTIASILPPDATITGVEREPQWVAEATAQTHDARIRYVQGAAESIPLDDASVDLVTCQTLLIHVADPPRVLREFARVLKPGGVLLAAEPNNVAAVVGGHAAPDADVDDVVAAFRLELVCEKGKHALGLGYNSLGEKLPGLLDDALWTDVRAWICDKSRVARPPYTDDVLAHFADERRWHDDGGLGWSKDETQRYWLAGGGDPTAFDDHFARARRVNERRLIAAERKTWAAVDGSLLYLIAARRL